MSSIQSTHMQPAAGGQAAGVPAPLVWLLATTAGVGVASLYYSQPMLGVLGPDLGASERAVGFVPTLTQLGYALGILLLAPLGDRMDRRRIILAKTAALMLALLASGLAPGLAPLLAASLAVGLAATLAQDVVPAAATLAPDHQRGKVVGTVMTGLLLGILLSRVASGLLAEHAGWRSVYLLAAAAMALLGVALWRGLPGFRPTTQLGYGALLGSMVQLWLDQPALRRAALAQGLLSVAFSAFWSTLAVMLHSQFHLGSAAAGSLGLAGAAGALAAPLAGRLADRKGPQRVTCLGVGLALASFALLALSPRLPASAQLPLLVVSAIGFDFGIQAALVAHQTLVYGLEPAARSRLNALLFTGVFIGMALGSALGAVALARWGWTGVVALACAACAAALATRIAPVER
ncbi:Inner membrane transport protein ynfM [Delftia tsuruhatensis]|uniref:MFS transporter n=1 Tax=Delftia tsuruhatensis TaxID=180282 RepID=UPI001E771D11|nr:MFS transporter [Delftia tsuruhatensis]CAB5711476.1 Inner membrane transport protein ynfM [Delftia tsuruhatensis]CAC9686806.1 Inner membrane transport protein ynfM [Delftia tsuruhatensis]